MALKSHRNQSVFWGGFPVCCGEFKGIPEITVLIFFCLSHTAWSLPCVKTDWYLAENLLKSRIYQKQVEVFLISRWEFRGVVVKVDNWFLHWETVKSLKMLNQLMFSVRDIKKAKSKNVDNFSTSKSEIRKQKSKQIPNYLLVPERKKKI